MSNKKELLEFLQVTKAFNSKISERKNKIIIENYPLQIFIEELDSNRYILYMHYRITSWTILEDRTNLHDLIPILLTVGLRNIMEKNFYLVNEGNDFSSVKSEIYSKFIIPSQPDNLTFDLSNNTSFQKLQEFIVGIFFIWTRIESIMHIDSSLPYESNDTSPELIQFSLQINSILSNSTDYYIRESTNPTFKYYRNINYEISVIQSEDITSYLKGTLNSLYKYRMINGINGDLLIAKNIKNVVLYDQLNIAKKIIIALDNITSEDIIPFDNFCILLGKRHFVMFGNDGDYNSFLNEKSLVRERHLNEVKVLFDELPIVWNMNTSADASIFEDMILELLEKESGILSVKKVAPTNQPDNGRDLIAHYTDLYINPHSKQMINGSHLIRKKMIVQCKTNLTNSQRQSIGKSQVDIANTLMDYEPNGYLLVVNTQITKDMTEYLEKLQIRGNYDINWWNKNDIEKRLRENPEIMNRYQSIVFYQ